MLIIPEKEMTCQAIRSSDPAGYFPVHIERPSNKKSFKDEKNIL